MLVDALLHQVAVRRPNAPAVIAGGAVRSFGELDGRSSQLARHLLGRGVSRGDRALVLLENGPDYLDAVFGLARAAMAVVPTNPAASEREVRTLIEQSRPRVVVASATVAEGSGLLEDRGLVLLTTGPEYEQLLARERSSPPAVPGREATDPWLIGYTSGTTGEPKGAVLSHRAKATSALVEAVEFATRDSDVALINTPMFHVHAIVHALTAIVAGGAVRIASRFDPEETLALVDRGEVTELSMVPTMYQALVDASATRSHARAPRLARCTGAAMPPKLRERMSDVFPDWPLHLFYGATEAGAISRLAPEDLVEKAGSVGLPFLGVDLDIRDDRGQSRRAGEEGEVFIKSPGAFSGYFGAPLNRYHGWLTLGDLGVLDADGFLALTGRTADQIVTGGEKVRPSEVEAVLLRQPGVHSAAVFGIADAYWGEAVWAAVEMPEAGPADESRLRAAAASELAPHKRPKRLLLMDELPRNAFGKIDKRRLRSLAEETVVKGDERDD